MVEWKIIKRDGSQHSVTGHITIDSAMGNEVIAGTLDVSPVVLDAFYDGVFHLEAPGGSLHSAVIDKLDATSARLKGIKRLS
jgi:hypothetical protein